MDMWIIVNEAPTMSIRNRVPIRNEAYRVGSNRLEPLNTLVKNSRLKWANGFNRQRTRNPRVASKSESNQVWQAVIIICKVCSVTGATGGSRRMG